MNRKVTLTKRVVTLVGKRYCKVVVSANGRIRPDYVLVNRVPEHHPEGAYYLTWYEGTKPKRLSVGKDAQRAETLRRAKLAELNALANGIALAPSPDASEADLSADANANRQTLADAASSYLEETKLTKKKKTLQAYRTALAYLTESCSKTYLDEIDRLDMLKFSAFLRDEKEQSPRSCWNKFSNVCSFLKAKGIRGLVNKNDWPRYVEDEPETYSKAELEKLFGACTTQERLWFDFFLCSGMREQEVMHSSWNDLDFAHSTVTIRWKPQYGWSPKAYKGREIPLPLRLITALREAKIKALASCD